MGKKTGFYPWESELKKGSTGQLPDSEENELSQFLICFDEICDSILELDLDEEITINNPQAMAMITIIHPKLKGHLFVATSAESVDEVLIQQINQYLMEILENKLSSSPLLLDAHFEFKIDTKFYSQNMQEKATKSFTGKHNLKAYNLAFIKNENLLHEMPKPLNGKVAVALATLSTEIKLTFQVHLYLERNRKFYSYINAGGRLMPKQKEKLMAQNMNHLFIAPDDLPAYRAHQGQLLLLSLQLD